MELKPRGHEKIIQLIDKGVDIPNPFTLDIGNEVEVGNISGSGVTIYPGCRIYGKDTVIARGTTIGEEGPVTIDNCQVGPDVRLKGGYFKESVFLQGVTMGLGAHVREACILEEEAHGAHCVALKHTILFPFVTLGSLINFCDCLMAGGTSRRNHSEVGSSYIHFNFTPDGDKTTPSLIGDVPRGVMLNQPPIFLGGQGGLVGPVRLGYGNVAIAGTVLRKDMTEDNKMIIGKTYPQSVMEYKPHAYPTLLRVLRNNLIYLGNLVALEHWYRNVRSRFFARAEYGELLYRGALDKLMRAKRERSSRLAAMIAKVPTTHEHCRCGRQGGTSLCELHTGIGPACEVFHRETRDPREAELRERFLASFETHSKESDKDYIGTIQSMPSTTCMDGVRWLQQIVDGMCREAAALLPSLRLF